MYPGCDECRQLDISYETVVLCHERLRKQAEVALLGYNYMEWLDRIKERDEMQEQVLGLMEKMMKHWAGHEQHA